MADNTQKIADLDAAIATGVRSITWDGVSTTFSSVDEMLRARRHLIETDDTLGQYSRRRVMTVDLSEGGTNTYPTGSSGGGSGVGVTDHGDLTGLSDDDHTQYLTASRGDARYYTRAQVDAGFATAAQGDLADAALQPADIADLVETTDARLSDARTPLAHAHTLADITDAGTAAGADAGDFATASHNHSGVYQPASATLTTLAASTAFAMSIMDDADAAAVRSTLGLGSLATLNSVALANMASMTDARLLGRSAGSAGVPQELTVGSGLTLSGGVLSASASGISDGDKGDITVTSSGAVWTVDASAITEAKLSTTVQRYIDNALRFCSTGIGGNAISGEYYDQSFSANTAQNIAGVANRIDLYPFMVSTDFSIDMIGCAVAVASGGATCKIVIYSAGVDGWPDVPVYQGGDLDCSSTGYKSEAMSFTFVKGTRYWVGVRHSGTAQHRGIAVAGQKPIGTLAGGSSATTYDTALRRTVTYASAAPSPWNFLTSDLVNTTQTGIRMRAV